MGTSRRDFLKMTGAGIASVSLAGCTGTKSSEPLAPQPDENKLKKNGWTYVDTYKNKVNRKVTIQGYTKDVTITTKTEAWKSSTALEDVRYDVNLGEDEFPSQGFYATKARTDPPISGLLSLTDAPLDKIISEIEPEARKRLQSRERVTSVRKLAEKKTQTERGEDAKELRYSVTVKHPEFEASINGQEVVIKAGEVTVELAMLVWVHNGLIASAGGVYPAKSQSFTALNGGRRKRFTITFDTQKYRNEILSIAKTVD